MDNHGGADVHGAACGRGRCSKGSCSPWRASAGAVCEDSILWEGLHTGPGEKREEEAAAEMKCYELIATPIIVHPSRATAGEGEEVEELGRKEYS